MKKEKFKDLVHHVIHEADRKRLALGAVRLNKVLWFADMFTYHETGKSMTGERYVKRDRGPVPKTILRTLEALQNEGKVSVFEPEFDFDIRRFTSNAPPSGSSLSDREKRMVDRLLDAVCDRSANEISDLTHGTSWRLTAQGEEIPLYATFADREGEITKQDRKWAEEEAKSWFDRESRYA